MLICNKVLTLRYIFVSSQDAMRYSLIFLQLMRPCNCACRPCSGMNLAFEEVVCCLLFFFKENTNPRKYRISTVKSQPFLICKTVWKNLHQGLYFVVTEVFLFLFFMLRFCLCIFLFTPLMAESSQNLLSGSFITYGLKKVH